MLQCVFFFNYILISRLHYTLEPRGDDVINARFLQRTVKIKYIFTNRIFNIGATNPNPETSYPPSVAQSIIIYQTPEISVFFSLLNECSYPVRCNKRSHKFPGKYLIYILHNVHASIYKPRPLNTLATRTILCTRRRTDGKKQI